MTYSQQFKSGHLVMPAALLIHFKDIFQSSEDFLVWQFFFLQNTSKIEEMAPSQIATALNQPLANINKAIANLQSQGLLVYQMDEMMFDASPALAKLDGLLQEKETPKTPQADNQVKALVADFERELGRLLSPFELEDLQKTLLEAHTSADLVRAALREAVFNGKANWKYIQAILRNWRREGITTPAQVEVKNAERDSLNNQQVTVSEDFLNAMNLWKDEV